MNKKTEAKNFTSLEICAGAGGQALGLENAGFKHIALVEIEPLACQTLRQNRPDWNVIENDVKAFSAVDFTGQVDLLAGGVPCPPFSIAGKQLGDLDDRDLFPQALRLIEECDPKAVMLENVRGILDPKFREYRAYILHSLGQLGYDCFWELLNSSDYGVSQLRPRAILIGLKTQYSPYFKWPKRGVKPKSIGELLYEEMASLGWESVDEWRQIANKIAPTLVGGSKKHGGADLGPTRAKLAWAELGVDGKGLANQPPVNGFKGQPRLTLNMTALVQGFPKSWEFVGKKTPAYRQVGNAFPPPVAEALGKSIITALNYGEKS